VRLVADTIRGISTKEARIKLDFITKRAAGPLGKLLNSAIANAKNLGADMDNLWIKTITVNGGRILYRRRPVSHGSAHPIRKRTSRITVVLAEKQKTATQKTKLEAEKFALNQPTSKK